MAGIINSIITRFSAQGAGDVENASDRIGRSQTRLGQASASAGRQFSAQASGLGGLVAAYAGAAATIFAVSAAFDALSRAAQSSQTLSGLQNLATASGESADALLASVRDITKGQLTITEAAQQINLSLSAGFDSSQIEGLANVALRASRALGRDLTDAYTRVIRGSAKLETELLDELGIYTKIDPAVRAYAAATGKVASELTEFERRQAFVNSVIAEGERKFNSINVTVPTSAEKIAAFGASIQDLTLSLGRLLADFLAPVAEYLTDNFAGSLAAVSALLLLVAKSTVAQLNVALKALQSQIAAVSQASSAWVAKSLGDFRQYGKAAQTAIQGTSLAMNGLNRANQAELKGLKETSQARKLNNAELRRAQAILTERNTKLGQNIQSLFDQRRAQQAVIRSTAATTAERAAATASLTSLNTRLATNIALLRATRTQLTATTAALGTFSVALGAATAGVIRFGGFLVTTAIASFARLLAVGGSLVGIVAVFGLIGSAIAGLIGKQEQYNALLERGALALKGFFAPSSFASFESEFTNLASSAVDQLDTVGKNLGDIEKFKIRDKVFGVEVDLTKTKEDLVKEVGNIVNQVATATNTSFTEALTGEAGRQGGVIGAVLGGIIGSVLPGIGTAAGAALGVVVGGTIGAAINAALASGSEVEAISTQNAERLGQLIGDSTIAGISQQAGNENLAKALNLLYEQNSVAAELSLEGRRYLRTQVELTKAIIENVDNIIQLRTAADALGLSVAQLEDKFRVSADAIGNTIISTINKGFDTVEVSIVLQNQEQIIADIERIRDLAIEASSPYELSPQEEQASTRATVDANTAISELNFINSAIQRMQDNVTDSTQAVVDNLNTLQNGFQAFSPRIETGDAPINTLNDLLEELERRLDASTNARGRALSGQGAFVAGIRRTIASVEDLIAAREREAARLGDLTSQQEEYNSKLEAANATIDALSAKKAREVFTQEQLTIVDGIVTSLGDLVLTLNATNRDLLASNNLLTDLVTSANSGTLSLENLAQASTSVNRAIARSSRGLVDAQTELNNLVSQRDALLATGVDPNSETVVAIQAQVAAQEQLVDQTAATLADTMSRNDAIQQGIAPLREQLEIAKAIKENFESEIKARQNAIGLFTATGQLTMTDDQEALARLDYLNDKIQAGSAALEQRNALEALYNEQLEGRPELVAQISSLIGEGADEARRAALETAGIDAATIAAVTSLSTLDAQTAALADNADTATDALQGSVIEFTRNIFKATVAAKEAISDLRFEIAQFARESEIARIEIQVELDEQGFDVTKTQLENEIESIENQIELLNQLTDLGNFRPISVLTDQVRTELGPALEASARRFEEITGRAAQQFSLEIPENLQGLSERDAAAKETQMQFSILEKRLQLNDLELERETNRIENERDLMQLEFDLFYAEQQFETQKQQALAELNRSQLQGLAEVYTSALIGQAQVQQQHVDALAQVFIQAANAMAAANDVEGFSASITPPDISSESITTQLSTNLEAAMQAYNNSIDEQIELTQELSDTRVQAEVELFAQRQILLDGEQAAAETAHQNNVNRIIQEGQITATAGANAIKEIEEAAGKAAEKVKMFTGRFAEMASGFKSAFSTAIGGVIDYLLYGGEEGESFGDRLKSVFTKLIQDIANTVLDKAIIEPVSNFLANKLTGFLVNRLPVDIMGDSMAEKVGGDAAPAASNVAIGNLGTSVSTAGQTAVTQINSTAQQISGALTQLGVNTQSGSSTASAQLSGAGAQLQGAQSAMGSQVQSGATSASTQIVTSGTQQATAQATAGTAIATAGATASAGIMAALTAILPILIILGITSLFRKKTSGGFAQMALGGAVKQLAAGGMLRDRVPALLEPGEFVIRRPAAKAIGGPVLQQMNATGKAPGSGAPVVNINNSGTPKDANVAPPRFDGERYIIDIVTRDLENNGPIRKTLRGGI